MAAFGERLRSLRLARGWRQQDLVDALDGQVARSTIANVETGREPPTPRLWSLVSETLSDWVPELAAPYTEARQRFEAGRPDQEPIRAVGSVSGEDPVRHILGGPFIVELLQLVYVFRHSRSPEEIIETRRVRATRTGADGYGLKLLRSQHDAFRVDEETLWGGHIADARHLDVDGRTIYLRRLEFGRRLRKGQVHEFAVRSWIDKDPEPGTSVGVSFTIPAKQVAIHLNFLGPVTPHECWSYGPVADGMLAPTESGEGCEPLTSNPGGSYSGYFTSIEAGAEYGIAWTW